MKHTLYLALACSLALPLAAQQTAPASAPSAAPNSGMQLIVTALGDHDRPAAPIAANQVEVKQGHDKDAVLQWAPFPTTERYDVALAIDDDTLNFNKSDYLDVVKTFLAQLPANAQAALLYLHTASFSVEANFNGDHAVVAQAVRAPSGAQSPSPFRSVVELLRRWPEHPGIRRELIIISDGQVQSGAESTRNPMVGEAVADAVAGGVVVYTIYTAGRNVQSQVPMSSAAPGAPAMTPPPGTPSQSNPFAEFGNLDTSAASSRNLERLAEETGGKAYLDGISNSSRLAGYLRDITARLESQYRLVIQPNMSKPKGMTRIEVKVHHSDAKITAPKWIYLAPPKH